MCKTIDMANAIADVFKYRTDRGHIQIIWKLTNAKLLIFLNLNKTQILTQKTNNTSHTKDLHQHTLSEIFKNKKGFEIPKKRNENIYIYIKKWISKNHTHKKRGESNEIKNSPPNSSSLFSFVHSEWKKFNEMQ